MSESISTEENSTPEEGPASLREALTEAFNESVGESTPEPDVTDIEPTVDEPQVNTSESQEAEDEPSEDLSQGEPEVIPAPQHWSDADREMFDSIPVETQQYLLKREEQYEQGIQSKSEELNPLLEAFGSYDQMLALRGVDKPTAIRTWAAAQAALDQDPLNGIKMLIETYGGEVEQQLRSHYGLGTEADDVYADPEVTKLRADLAEQKRQQSLSQMHYAQQRNAEAGETVRLFKEQKNDDGELTYPHFDEAQTMMRVLLQSGTAPDLETAYKEAIWSVPEYREAYAKDVQSRTDKEQSNKRTIAAAKAKKTATAVRGNGSKPPPQQLKATLRDDLKSVWDDSLTGD